MLDLVAADDPDRHPVVLTPGERVELRDGLREMRGFLREAKAALGAGEPGLADALLAARGRGAMRPPRRVRKRKGGNHLSISARNAEWEAVRASADRAGLPIARYVKRLVDRDLGGDWGFTALAPEEQRELLEGMREIRALLREGAARRRGIANRPARRRPGHGRGSPRLRRVPMRRSRRARRLAKAACSGSEAGWSRRSSS